MNTPSWVNQSFFYHIYPLGMFGAPKENDFQGPVEYRLDKLYSWMDHLNWLGINALYLGPVFESGLHGYDTTDFYKIDRRLGDVESFNRIVAELHRRGIRLILDGVFNHVGRSFFAFRDLQMNGEASVYKDWFAGLEFGKQNPYGDPFTYETWAGHYSLPKLNLKNPQVRDHIISAVQFWMETWQIDGLRLDAADVLDFDFLTELKEKTRSINPEFWLMGEVVHGDYSQWANEKRLDSVTNYECYKGLYSSLNDANYFEIAYALNRQSGSEGLYKDIHLYNFVDNHDVNRVASQLDNPDHLRPLYGMLMTMPGVPSIYYGSEWGINGKRTEYSDQDLRPFLDLNTVMQNGPRPDLPHFIRQLADIRKETPALRLGNYEEVIVQHTYIMFKRQHEAEVVYVVINAGAEPVNLDQLPLTEDQDWFEKISRQKINRENRSGWVIPSNHTQIFVNA